MYNVKIRPLVEEDADISFKWRNDPEVWQLTGSRPNILITKELEREWLQKVLADPTSKRFAILCNEKYIGNIQLTDIKNYHAEYHIFIGDKEFWGKGIASLATYQILSYAKGQLNLHEVYLSVKKENIAAIKSYIRNSFVEISEEKGWVKMICKLD